MQGTTIILHNLAGHKLAGLVRHGILLCILVPGLKLKELTTNQTKTTPTYQIAVIKVRSSSKLRKGVVPEVRVQILRQGSETTILKGNK